MINPHSHRKDEHVSLAEYFNRQQNFDEFNHVRFIHQSLPECSYQEINPTTRLGPLKLSWPFYIEAMTGGSLRTQKLNAQLSQIARTTHLAMASGSQRITLNQPQLIPTFTTIRHHNPDGTIIANTGASSSVPEAQRIVKMLHADALELHVNVPQELIMPEGARSFYWLKNIQAINQRLKIPVIVKEVGFGMAKESIQNLKKIGIKYINVGGRGGTNFAKIENFRRHNQELGYLANWGQSTIESLLESRPFEPQMTVIASGGVKNALDVAKAIALGASAVGIAGAILHSLLRNGKSKTVQLIRSWQLGLKIIMTMLGCRNIHELQKQRLILNPKLISYLKQRHLKY